MEVSQDVTAGEAINCCVRRPVIKNEATKKGKIFRSTETLDTSNAINFKSFGDSLLRDLENKFADSVLWIDVASGRQWTGKKLRNKILDIATCLVDKFDLRQGDITCISFDHSDYTCLLAVAIVCAGGAVSCAYYKDPYPEFLHLSRKIEPKFFFCPYDRANWAEKFAVDMGYPLTVVVMDKTISDVADSSIHTFDQLLNYDHMSSESIAHIPRTCRDITKDVAFISMSSGTTGKPKAVPVTHITCCSGGFSSRRADGLKFASKASLDYVSGRLVILGYMATGYTAVILANTEPKYFLEAIEKYKINFIYLGVASFYALITHPDVDKYDLSSLLQVFPMGAKLVYLEELREFFNKHPNIKVVKQGYGTTETTGGAMNSFTPEEYLKDCDNNGKLLPGVEMKVVDPETGELLGTNQQGLLYLKSHVIFPGYYDMETARKRAGSDSEINPFVGDPSVFDEDGFYATGDIVYMNEKEELYVVGRQKELMCCRGAKKVLPQELEELIIEHPAVDEVCVIGVPNKLEPSLHCPRAFVVIKPYESIKSTLELLEGDDTIKNSADDPNLRFRGIQTLASDLPEEIRRQIVRDVNKFVNDRIGWEKHLTGGIVVVDSIPTLRETGKMNKNYLRSLTEDQVEIYGDLSR